MSESYECPMHKNTHPGQPRATFQEELRNALLNGTMHTAMRLYKEIKAQCSCPENYALFDAILSMEHKDPKPSTT
jgi:hypothetical protein